MIKSVCHLHLDKKRNSVQKRKKKRNRLPTLSEKTLLQPAAQFSCTRQQNTQARLMILRMTEKVSAAEEFRRSETDFHMYEDN